MISKSSLFLLIAAMAVSIVFTGCPGSSGSNDDDDDGSGGSPSTVTKITARVENGASLNAEVDNVKALLEGSDFVAGSGAYANGGFTLSLDATIDEQYLDYWESDDGLTVSDPNVMVSELEVFTAYKSGVEVGDFVYGTFDPNGEEPETGVLAYFQYADRAVTIKGSGSYWDGDSYTYNVSLKKGWNIVYEIWNTNTGTFRTGAAPAEMKWQYEPDEENGGSGGNGNGNGNSDAGPGPAVCANIQDYYNNTKKKRDDAQRLYDESVDAGSIWASSYASMINSYNGILANYQKMARENGCTLSL